MFYIINKNADFIRSHSRWGSPEAVHLGDAWENKRYADKFRTKAEAETQLAIWAHNNDFKGRVIDEQTTLEMGA
ncbi:hypothetical protein Ab1vBOLIVR4_gp75 [Agrobacterium phage OLIVR4]|nr:hypothetical protein Ab1vBOLIVR4_gp75 [Agrobacterium phage OLIVR4]